MVKNNIPPNVEYANIPQELIAEVSVKLVDVMKHIQENVDQDRMIIHMSVLGCGLGAMMNLVISNCEKEGADSDMVYYYFTIFMKNLYDTMLLNKFGIISTESGNN